MATVNEIQLYIGKVLAEVKKKKEKADKLKRATEPKGYSYAESLDFSAPLGAYNLYRSQGAVNWGPMTGPGTKIDDRISGQRVGLESVLRGAMKEAVSPSAWDPLRESVIPEGVWGDARRIVEGSSEQEGEKAAQAVEAHPDEILKKLQAKPEIQKKLLALADKAEMSEGPKDLGSVDATGTAMSLYPAAAYLLHQLFMGGGSTGLNFLSGLSGGAAMMAVAAIANLVQHKKKTGVEFSAGGKPMESKNVWEAAQHYYDHQGFGLGGQTAEGIEAKKKKKVAAAGKKLPATADSIKRTKYGKVAVKKASRK